jgi:hypothetical protein
VEVEWSVFKTEFRALIKYGTFLVGDLYIATVSNRIIYRLKAHASKLCSLQNLSRSITVNDNDLCT